MLLIRDHLEKLIMDNRIDEFKETLRVNSLLLIDSVVEELVYRATKNNKIDIVRRLYEIDDTLYEKSERMALIAARMGYKDILLINIKAILKYYNSKIKNADCVNMRLHHSELKEFRLDRIEEMAKINENYDIVNLIRGLRSQ